MTGWNLAAVPDAEQLLTDTLAALGGIRVWVYDSRPGVHALWETSTAQVDVRASSKQRARDRAYEARTLILALEGVAWDDGRVHAVSIVAGPYWNPAPDGAPAYALRVSLHYRAVPA